MKKSEKAFTLIEVLMVIAIVGILAAIILVKLSDSRRKALDSAIIQAANTMMKAALIETSADGDFVAHGWGSFEIEKDSPNQCTSFNSVNAKDSTIAACREIITKNSSMLGNNEWGLRVGRQGAPSNVKFSIMAKLPGSGKVYCIGSNGKSSMTTPADTGNCPSTMGVWNCPGCILDTE